MPPDFCAKAVPLPVSAISNELAIMAAANLGVISIASLFTGHAIGIADCYFSSQTSSMRQPL